MSEEMLPLEFFGQNFHFALSVFAALVFFAIFWLIFDAWVGRREPKELFKWLGFLLLSISFLIHATVIEQSVFASSLFGDKADLFASFVRGVGYLGIIWGLFIDPLQPVPETEGLVLKKEKKAKGSSAVWPGLSISFSAVKFFLPIGSLAVALLYLRRATAALEKHLRAVFFGFLFLGGSEILSLASFLRGTSNPLLYSWIRPFGVVWVVEHLLLFISVVILGKWGWSYLVTRLQSQLFMIFTSTVLAIFLLTTVSFTFLLMQNIQRESLANLETAAKVLDYALSSKKTETAVNAEAIAQNSEITAAVVAKDRAKLVALTSKILETKKQSSIVVTDEFSQVLVRAEDPERWGDSISADPLIERALIGDSNTSVVSKEDVLAPLIYIKSASPIRDSSKNIVGAVIVGLVIDDAFVDGVKNATGLDSGVYAGNVRSATSFLSPDGKHRYVGIKEENSQVKKEVLQEGGTFKGSLNVLNRPFLAVYVPLRDVDNSVVGMLFIGRPLSSILQSAGKSIELTFLVAAVLLIISIVPAYLISKYLTSQLR